MFWTLQPFDFRSGPSPVSPNPLLGYVGHDRKDQAEPDGVNERSKEGVEHRSRAQFVHLQRDGHDSRSVKL